MAVLLLTVGIDGRSSARVHTNLGKGSARPAASRRPCAPHTPDYTRGVVFMSGLRSTMAFVSFFSGISRVSAEANSYPDVFDGIPMPRTPARTGLRRTHVNEDSPNRSKPPSPHSSTGSRRSPTSEHLFDMFQNSIRQINLFGEFNSPFY